MSKAKQRRFTCHVCGKWFHSHKPQDPERDRGYGTCEACHPIMVHSMMKYGFNGRPQTAATAQARLDRYA